MLVKRLNLPIFVVTGEQRVTVEFGLVLIGRMRVGAVFK